MSEEQKFSWDRPRYLSDNLFDAFFQNSMPMLEEIEKKFSREDIINALNHQCNLMKTDSDNQPLYREFLEFRNAWINGSIERK